MLDSASCNQHASRTFNDLTQGAAQRARALMPHFVTTLRCARQPSCTCVIASVNTFSAIAASSPPPPPSHTPSHTHTHRPQPAGAIQRARRRRERPRGRPRRHRPRPSLPRAPPPRPSCQQRIAIRAVDSRVRRDVFCRVTLRGFVTMIPRTWGNGSRRVRR